MVRESGSAGAAACQELRADWIASKVRGSPITPLIRESATNWTACFHRIVAPLESFLSTNALLKLGAIKAMVSKRRRMDTPANRSRLDTGVD